MTLEQALLTSKYIKLLRWFLARTEVRRTRVHRGLKYTQQRSPCEAGMVLDIAKPVALLLLILSLYAAFHAAFLVPSAELQDRIYSALVLLAISGGISLSGGMLFRESMPERGLAVPLAATLPVRIYCWGASGMAILFGLSWYVESYSALYPNVRY